MTPERRRKVEQLYQAARDGEPAEREAILAKADPELRREIESLLNPAGLKLTPGAQLGPYRIETSIGAGGMGEVFRALDTRLGRKVAIKTSREEFSSRFEREARVISSLNHPNICTLYDVGANYLVMELVEGPTLAERIKQGAVPLAE